MSFQIMINPHGILTAPVIGLAGVPGAGKTTLATSPEGSLLLACELPGSHIDVPTIDLYSNTGMWMNASFWWENFVLTLAAICSWQRHPSGRGLVTPDGYHVQNLVVDSLKPIETQAAACKLLRLQAEHRDNPKSKGAPPSSLEEAGGFKAYDGIGEIMDGVMTMLHAIRMKGVQVIVICHLARTTHKSLDADAKYETFTLDLQQGDGKYNRVTTMQSLLQRVDEMWEVTQPITVEEIQKRVGNRTFKVAGRPVMAGDRIVLTRPSAVRPYLKTRSPFGENAVAEWPELRAKLAWWNRNDDAVMRKNLVELLTYVYENDETKTPNDLAVAVAKVPSLDFGTLMRSQSSLQKRADAIDAMKAAGTDASQGQGQEGAL